MKYKCNLYDVSINTNAGADFFIVLGDFLDEFYRSDPFTRSMMLQDMPVDMPKPEMLPFLAATAHRLANVYKLNAPQWVFNSCCYLPGPEPFFGCGAMGKLRLLFMYKSPPEFKHRNLFVDENVLLRV